MRHSAVLLLWASCALLLSTAAGVSCASCTAAGVSFASSGLTGSKVMQLHGLFPLRGGEDEGVVARDKELIQKLQGMRNEASAIFQRREMLEQEVEDHALVSGVLKQHDGQRRCYRSVGGVLMESTVGDVLPAVGKEQEMLAKAHSEMTAKLISCQKDIREFQEKHGIRMLHDPADYFLPDSNGENQK